MALFLSKSVNKIDRKGRVSVPAAFRAALGTEISEGVALMPSLREDCCVEGCGMSRIALYAEMLEELNPLSEERAALETAVLADMRVAQFDSEGRIVLPEEFIELAQLEDQALFAGLGKVFQIWNPAVYEEHRARARELARKNISQLPWAGGRGKQGGGAEQ